MKASIAEQTNYTAATSGAVTLTITSAELTGVSVSQSGTLTYNGEEQIAVVSTSATTVDNSEVTFTYSTSEGGTYSDTVPAFTTAGMYTVYYRAAAANYTTVSGSFTVTIVQKTVTASISGTTAKTYDGTTALADGQSLSITLSGVVDGDTVTAGATVYTYNSADVDSADTITASGISLSGTDKDNYTLSNTTATISGTINPKEITVTITSNGGTYGGTITAATAELSGVIDADKDNVPVTLTYTGTANDGSTTYNGSVVPSEAGSYTVTATISNSNYKLTGTTTAAFTVERAESGLSVGAGTAISKTYGDSSFDLNATWTDKVNATATYVSSDTSVATVSADGTVTIVGAGTATITVSVPQTANYNSGSVEVTLTVAKKDNTLTVEASSYEVTYGAESFNLGANAENGTVTYESSNAAVATVDDSGNVTITGAGSATITLSIAASDNYNAASTTVTVKVNPATPGITLTAKSETYTGKAIAIDTAAVTLVNGETYDETVNGEITYTYYTDEDCTILTGSSGETASGAVSEGAAPVNAGTYYVKASIAANGNYTAATSEVVTLKITAAKLTVTAADKTITYGDAAPAYTVTYDGFVTGEDKSDLGGTLEFTCAYKQYSDKGTYAITPSGYTSSNYDITYVAGTLTVDPKAIMVTIADQSSIYGDAIETLTAEVTSGSIVNDDTDVYSLSTTASKTAPVGSYDITGMTENTNYRITFVNEANAYTITTRELTVAVVVADKAYDGTNTATISSATLNNIANDDSVTLVNGTAIFDSVNVGTDIAISFTDFTLSGDEAVLANYTITQPIGVTASITVATLAAADFMVTQLDGDTTVTLGTDEAVDISFTGSEIKPSVDVAADSIVTADDYEVEYGTNTAVGSGSGTVTITGKGNFTGTLVYTFNIIDQEVPTGTITIGTNAWNKFWNTVTFGLFFNKTQTVTVEAPDNDGVATTEYYLAGAAVDSTDDLAGVTWTAFSGSFGIDPEKTCVVYVKITDNSGNSTIINSDGIVLETTAPEFAGIADGETYCDSVTFTVTEANLSEVTVDGDALTANEDGSYTIIADDETHVVTATDKAGNSTSVSITVNTVHTWDYTTDGTTITEICKYCGETASVTISEPEGEQTYDGGSHDAGLSYSGTPSGSAPTITYTLNGDSVGDTTQAGEYTAAITYGGVNASVTYTVAKAEATITAADASKTYGEDDPELTGTVEGVLDADMDSLGVTYIREAGENVGTYIITPSYTENSNYDITIQTSDFTISKRAITVTANASSITYGDEPSANGVTYDGFVNGEDENVLTGELKYSYTYEQYGDVGTYSITPSGLSSGNYEITYENGTLTVLQRTVELIWTALSAEDLVYDGTAKTLSASVANKADENDDVLVQVEVNGDNENVTATGFYYTATELTGEDSGNYCLPDDEADRTSATYIITDSELADVSVVQTGTLTYNGTAQTAEVATSATTVDGTEVTFTYSESEDGPYTAEVPAFTNAGTYTVYYRAEAANHATASGSFTVTIAKAVYDISGVSFADVTYTYDGTEKTLTITGSEKLPEGVSVSYENNTLTNAGSVTATAIFTGDADNYEAIASRTATLTIINADFTITVTGYEGAYDGDAHGITVTADEGVTVAYSISEADSKDYSETNPTFTDAGTYTVYYKAGKSNYNDVTGSATVVITQATGEGSVSITGWIYGEYDVDTNSPDPVSATNGTDNVTYLYKAQGADDDTYTDEVPTDAGSYTVQATFAETNNYKAVTTTADFTIAKAESDLLVGVDLELSKTYGDDPFTLDATGEGGTVIYESSDEAVVTVDENGEVTIVGAGEAAITISIADSSNYNGTETTITITVNSAKLANVTVEQDGTLTYDGTAQTAEVTAGATTADGTDDDVAFTYSTSEEGTYTAEVPAFTNAGTYTVYYRAEAENHTTASGSFTITIAAKSVTASISGTTEKTYDGTTDTTAEQGLSIELSGVVEGDTVTAAAESYTYDSEDAESASTIIATGIALSGEDAGNYKLTSTTATTEGSITAKEITVTITANGGTYDGTITAATAELDGVTDADEGSIEVTLTYTGMANDGTEYSSTEVPTLAGTYTVTAVVSDSNYSLTGTTTAEFVIARATYDMSGVSFTDTTYRYDGTEKTLTISGSESLPEGVTVSYENNTLTDAGSTVAAATFTGDADNYEVPESMTATLTVAVLTDLPEQDFPDEAAEHKVEVQEGLTEVPEALQDNTELDTVEKIETQLKTLVVGQIGYTEENTIIYDVTLMISFDGGLTWEKATAENFPEGGLTVILPYPEGTNKEEYDFTVIHMFTTSAFGKTPGDTEILDPVKTDEGLQVTLTGLSPIIVAWKLITQSSGETETESETTVQSGSETESETTAQSETETESETTAQSEAETESGTTVQSETETESGTTVQSGSETESETAAQSGAESESETEASVQTGDETPLGIWLTMFLLSAAVLLMMGERKRQRR